MLDLIITWKDIILMWCRDHPVWLFAAIAILPGCAFPVSPLLILAGAVWGGTPTACALALAAILINITWTHLLAAGPSRSIIIRMLGNRWTRWQQPKMKNHWRVVCMLRLTPGIPLCIQNYLIGLLGIPLKASVILAIPITGTYVCGFVLTGGAIFEGRIGMLLLGVSLLIITSLMVSFLHRKIFKSKPLNLKNTPTN